MDSLRRRGYASGANERSVVSYEVVVLVYELVKFPILHRTRSHTRARARTRVVQSRS